MDALQAFLAPGYLWIKALHVMAVISYMAGILYLIRLYVNHAMESEAVVMERFQGMERRLLNAITNPALVVMALTGGLMLLANWGLLSMPWMMIKLTMVVGLVVVHVLAMQWRVRLMTEPHFKSHVFFRYMNELPTLFMIIIVIMVVVKPMLWRS